ncbi:hypothetical protein CVT24_009042 [Panaeolus cyanescens]|uniref:SURF1-like protein n=1 Tax=Panaeolus cyanescens TaxID=181874 RepID=A0A409YAL0_9AGAR|nr:hypothetical protein CVT24_009042 [Panaeolus cyanescens]
MFNIFRRSLHATTRLNLWTFGRRTSNVPAVYKARREPWLKPVMVLVGVMPIFTFALGTWQLKRLKWKINLIDELEEKLQLAPLSLPPNVNLSVIPDFVFRRVRIRGKWDHAHTMILGPRTREGLHGVHIVTPLVRENGSTVLVDRGFVSNEQLKSLGDHLENDEVEVLGMLRVSPPRNRFTPDNDPTSGKWYWPEVDKMAEFAGGHDADVQPVYIEQIFDGHAGDALSRLDKGIPVGRAPTVDLRNSHLSYVITWYALSGLTSMMFLRLWATRRNSPGRRMPRFG